MKKIVLSGLLMVYCIALVTCSKPGAAPQEFPNLPEGLVDCKFYRLTDLHGVQALIGRCPNSTVTVRSAVKAPVTIVTDDPATDKEISKATSKISSVPATKPFSSSVSSVPTVPHDWSLDR